MDEYLTQLYQLVKNAYNLKEYHLARKMIDIASNYSYFSDVKIPLKYKHLEKKVIKGYINERLNDLEKKVFTVRQPDKYMMELVDLELLGYRYGLKMPEKHIELKLSAQVLRKVSDFMSKHYKK